MLFGYCIRIATAAGRDLARLTQLTEPTAADRFSPADQEQILAALADHGAALRAVTGERAEDARAA
ncbi:MAG: hypothetical protein ABIQ65_02070 [Thermoanaerobaculia bacterium]